MKYPVVLFLHFLEVHDIHFVYLVHESVLLCNLSQSNALSGPLVVTFLQNPRILLTLGIKGVGYQTGSNTVPSMFEKDTMRDMSPALGLNRTH